MHECASWYEWLIRIKQALWFEITFQHQEHRKSVQHF